MAGRSQGLRRTAFYPSLGFKFFTRFADSLIMGNGFWARRVRRAMRVTELALQSGWTEEQRDFLIQEALALLAGLATD